MTSTAPAEKNPAEGYLIESSKRLSDSMLWNLQRQYYDQRGLSAWASGAVPSYVTSNPYIANAYAQVVMAFLRDAAAAPPSHNGACLLKRDKPIYIVELAAGHGRFSFLFLKKLLSLLAQSSLRDLNIRYVMTDFTESNLRSWQAQPLFKPFIESGVLDFGLFDIEKDTTIKLWYGGQPLTATAVENPLIIIGNYIFDTLTQDLFRFDNGQVYEMRVTTYHSHQQAPDLSNPEVMSQFSMTYEPHLINPATYYSEPFLNQLLLEYRDRLSDTTIALPTGALRGIFRLLELSGKRCLLLSSDKGYTHEDELFFLTNQHIQFHGSLSMMVNFHCMGLALGHPSIGGLSMATAQRHINLKTAGFLVGAKEEMFRDTLLCFREQMDVFGPYDFYTLTTQARQSTQNPQIEQILCLLRLSQYDPNLVLEFSKELLEQAPALSETIKQELYLALLRCWENFYPLGRDLPFEVARILLAMRRPKEAVLFNQHSIELFGEHPVTLGNMGICYYHAEEPEEALRCFDLSLHLNPNYGLPKAWKARLSGEKDRQA